MSKIYYGAVTEVQIGPFPSWGDLMQAARIEFPDHPDDELELVIESVGANATRDLGGDIEGLRPFVRDSERKLRGIVERLGRIQRARGDER